MWPRGIRSVGWAPSALQKSWLARYHGSGFILNSSLLPEARKLKTTFLGVPCRWDSKNQINSRDSVAVREAGLWWRWPGSEPAAELWLPEPTGDLIQQRLRQWKQGSQRRRRQLGLGSGSGAWEITAQSNVCPTTGNEIY